MKKNMGLIDRIIRALLVALALGLYAAGVIAGTPAILTLILAAVFIGTSLISWCPIYQIFGISSCRNDRSHAG